MKIKGFLLMFLLLTGTSGYVFSQFNVLDKAKRAVNRKVDQKIDKAINKTVDAAADSIENDIKNNKQKNNDSKESGDSGDNNKSNDNKQNSNQGFNPFGGGGKETKTEKQYSFTGNIVMNVKTYDKKDKLEADMIYTTYIDEKSKNVATKFVPSDKKEEVEMTMIYDTNNKSMVMITLDKKENKRSGIVMAIPEPKGDGKKSDEKSKEAKQAEDCFKKTGNTKTLTGYKCEEYVCDDDKSTTTMWVSNDLLYNLSGTYGNFSKNKNLTNKNYPSGMMLEMTMFDKKEKTKVVTTVTSINLKQSSTIDISDVQLMNMGGMFGK